MGSFPSRGYWIANVKQYVSPPYQTVVQCSEGIDSGLLIFPFQVFCKSVFKPGYPAHEESSRRVLSQKDVCFRASILHVLANIPVHYQHYHHTHHGYESHIGG